MENTTEVKKAEKVVDPKREARKAAKKALREKKAVAFEALRSAIEKSGNQALIKVLNDFNNLKAERTGGASGEAIYSRFVAFVTEKREVSEDEIFKTFKVGRKDCAGFIRKYLKTVGDPNARIWINFTPSNGMYKMIGKGTKAPAEYTGYVPTDDLTDLKAPTLK